MCMRLTVTHLRSILQNLFPDVEDGRWDNEPYEHPMTAVGVVLMSAAIMGTIDPTTLMLFTAYSRPFLSAIAVNMQNNHLWIDGLYRSSWLSSDGTIDGESLWTHIDIACAMEWLPTADTDVSADSCDIYWDERGGFKKGGKRSETIPRVH